MEGPVGPPVHTLTGNPRQRSARLTSYDAERRAPVIAGVDGYKKGWMAAVDDGGSITVRPFPAFAGIAGYLDLSLIVVDIPIGLPSRGSRRADLEACRYLRARACCVLPCTLPANP